MTPKRSAVQAASRSNRSDTSPSPGVNDSPVTIRSRSPSRYGAVRTERVPPSFVMYMPPGSSPSGIAPATTTSRCGDSLEKRLGRLKIG